MSSRALKSSLMVCVFSIVLQGCAKFEGVAWPTRDMADDGDSMWKAVDLGGKRIVGTGSWQNRIWLNFEGATVPAADSFIVDRFVGSDAVIPAFESADLGSTFASQDRATLISQAMLLVAEEFEGLDINFSTTPPEAPFSTVHIGGANFTGINGVAGIAPLDIGNLQGSDVLFVFADELSSFNSLPLLVNDICHEVGHALGARHIAADGAMLNPILPLAAGVLNVGGKVTPGDGEENSFDVLRANLGTTAGSSAVRPETVPTIISLSIASQGNVANLSVFHPANVAANPAHHLNDFLYTWTFQGQTAEGPTVLADFTDVKSDREVKVKVDHPDNDSQVTFTFPIGDGK